LAPPPLSVSPILPLTGLSANRDNLDNTMRAKKAHCLNGPDSICLTIDFNFDILYLPVSQWACFTGKDINLNLTMSSCF
jgi:hypothetical protein